MIGEIKNLGLRRRPAASCGCPTVYVNGKAALGGFKGVLADFLVSLVTSTCTFSKTYLKRARSNLCGTPLSTSSLRVSGVVREQAQVSKTSRALDTR